MPAFIAALLAAGTLLAGAGLAGFTLVWTTAPDRTDLAHARALATIGQWATTIGLLTLWTSPYRIGGTAGAALTIATLVFAASFLTKAPLRHLRVAG
jgi:hypothetical protein